MIQICYSKHHVGDRKFGEKLPLEDKRETHGFCEHCRVLEIQDIEMALGKRRGQRSEVARASIPR